MTMLIIEILLADLFGRRGSTHEASHHSIG
jgi:hypothetical protein